jgi:thiol:disulfide interchange protein/DsbC/DsbD-like thiol-disulfide interchange protein
MRITRPFFVLIFAFALGLRVFAASDSAGLAHVQVKLIVVPSQLNKGEANRGGLYFKLDQGWHVYWKNPGDAGEPPHIQWTLPSGVSAGPLQFPTPKRLPLGPLMDYGYEDEVLFPLDLNVANSAKTGAAVLHAKADWLVCRATCIPQKAELEVSRNIVEHGSGATPSGPDRALFARFESQIPKSLPKGMKAVFAPIEGGYRLEVQREQPETSAEFFPEDPDILDNPAPQRASTTVKGLAIDLKKDVNATAGPRELKGILKLSGERAFAIVALPGAVSAGGVPMAAPSAGAVQDKASAAAGTGTAQGTAGSNAGESNRPGLLKAVGLAFAGGLLLNLMPCVFPVLFLKGLALVQSGNEERHRLRTHGYVYAAGILVSFWALVALLLGLRAAGSRLGWGFQFQSPAFIWLMGSLLFFLGLSLAGQFEIGLTLTSAGGSLASKQGYSGSFFTGVLAVIVATPCTAPFMGAAIGYALAQPAVVTFAVFTALGLGLAAPYLALTMQPAWTRLLPRPGAWMDVLKQAISVPIFATVIWLAWVLTQAYGAAMLAAVLGGFLLLAIAGWFLGRWPAQRWATAVAGVIVLCVAAAAVMAPRSLGAAQMSASAGGETKAGWEPWSAEAVSRYQAEGRPVFVDFTASWCLSCQVNERIALTQPEVRKAFADANAVLMRADWTRHDEAITQTLTSLGRSGVPAYAFYAPGQSSPEMLPEVLTPGIVLDAIAKQRKGAQANR